MTAPVIVSDRKLLLCKPYSTRQDLLFYRAHLLGDCANRATAFGNAFNGFSKNPVGIIQERIKDKERPE